MDKKEQHEESGELHSKAPPNNLPPIWDNISSALDAEDCLPTESDELDLVEEQEHEADVASFSVIKAGFVATFGQQVPPKFLWDTIEQDLEANIDTDAPTEFSAIKDSFLATYGEHQPPQSFWKALSERVDQPEEDACVEENADYSRIKKSFERKYSSVVVPLFSWDDLAERMDTEAILADTANHYSVIKDSFETVYAGKEPSVAIAKILWKRMYPLAMLWSVLQKTVYSPRIRGSVAALLFVFAIGKSDTNSNLDAFSENTLLADQGTEQRYTLEAPTKTRDISPSILTKEEKNIGSTVVSSTVSKVKSQLEAATLTPKTLATIITAQEQQRELVDNKKGNKQPYTNTTASHPIVAPNNFVDQPITGVNIRGAKNKKGGEQAEKFLLIDKTTSYNTGNQAAHVLTSNKSNAKKIDDNYTVGSTNSPVAINNLSQWGIRAGQLEVPVLPTAKITLVDQGANKLSSNYIPNPAIAWMERSAFREVRPAIRGKKIHFEFGLEGRLGTSLLLQKPSIEQQEKEVQLYPTGAVGINFQYYFGLNDAIVIATRPYATVVQSWKDKVGGGATQDISLSFMDLNVGYQRILFHYNTTTTDALASVYARIDLGVGWLMHADTRVNQRTIYAPNLYQNFNWTAGLAIGNLHRMQRFVLDYGLMSNIGLNKLITAAQPNLLQPARLVNIGGYIGLRYTFTPRQAPSKKQRQFDWSAPFYIEEPKF